MRRYIWVVCACFFLCGFSTTLNDTLIPYLRRELGISFTQVMAVQFCFYFAYFSLCPCAGPIVAGRGYRSGLVLGLGCGFVGALLLSFATTMAWYWLVLLSIFTLGSGVAILQVAGNPLILDLMSSDRSTSKLTFVQGFTALGMFTAPYVGSFFLNDHNHLDLASLYPLLALGWLLTMLSASRGEELLVPEQKGSPVLKLQVLRDPAVSQTFLLLFAYVGVEVAVGSFMISFLRMDKVGPLSFEFAGRLCALYWGGLFVGRFLGAPIMGRTRPLTLMIGCTTMASLFLFCCALGSGPWLIVCLALVGLCNSILFPAVFSEGMSRIPGAGPQVAGILCMANIGGALWPMGQALIADQFGLQVSFFLPAIGYLVITAGLAIWFLQAGSEGPVASLIKES